MGQDPTERPRSGRRIGRAGVEAMLGLRIQEKCPLFQGTMKKSLVVERCCSWLGEKEASPSCSSLWCPWCMNEWSCSGRDKAGSDGFRFAEVQFLLLVKMFMLMQVSNWSNRGPFLLRRVRCKTALAGSHNVFLGASFIPEVKKRRRTYDLTLGPGLAFGWCWLRFLLLWMKIRLWEVRESLVMHFGRVVCSSNP